MIYPAKPLRHATPRPPLLRHAAAATWESQLRSRTGIPGSLRITSTRRGARAVRAHNKLLLVVPEPQQRYWPSVHQRFQQFIRIRTRREQERRRVVVVAVEEGAWTRKWDSVTSLVFQWLRSPACRYNVLCHWYVPVYEHTATACTLRFLRKKVIFLMNRSE